MLNLLEGLMSAKQRLSATAENVTETLRTVVGHAKVGVNQRQGLQAGNLNGHGRNRPGIRRRQLALVRPACHFVRGFSTSLRASPRRFQQKIIRNTTAMGAINCSGWFCRTDTPLLPVRPIVSPIIRPRLGRPTCTPSPKKLSTTSDQRNRAEPERHCHDERAHDIRENVAHQ